MQVTISGEQGGALAIVHADGTVEVFSVPPQCAITITGQRGFGDATDLGQFNLTDSVGQVHYQLGFDGAK